MLNGLSCGLVALALGLSAGCATSVKGPLNTDHDLSRVVESQGVDPDRSALLIVRLSDGRQWRSGDARVDQSYPPASTSKIPHTLIALETGYAGPDTIFKWDGKKRFVEAWNQDQTLASAFKYSAVWSFQQITEGIGHEVMSEWINRFDYGNRNIGAVSELDRYWLVGPLETSARDQVRFLSRLATETLPLSASTYQDVRQIMRVDHGETWTLYAKSGWRMDGVNVDIGWYVGWLQQQTTGSNQAYVFAFNMDMTDSDDRARRQRVVRAALTEIGVLTD